LSIACDATSEIWCSEELAAVVLDVMHVANSVKETRIELTNIKKMEPDPALFKIAEGYAVASFEQPDMTPKAGLLASGFFS
jgi:hypothetical protein